MVQVCLCHDEGTTGLGHLLAIYGQESVTEYFVWLTETGAFQHCRPEQGVEVGDIFTDKVVQLGVGGFRPVFVEIHAVFIAPVLKAGHVADWGIQPHVEVFARCIWDFKTPVWRITGDIPVLQTRLKPLVEFVDHLFLYAFIYPAAQELFKITQFKEVVFRFFLNWFSTRDSRVSVFQLNRAVGRATFLAGIAILIRFTTLRAFAFNETVRQEHLFFRVVCLSDGFFSDMPTITQSCVDSRRKVFVFFRMG